MTGCPTHGPLLGGYVLRALEPDEMEEMRRHVAACPHCGPEVDRLTALPGLLDRIVPADVPPPSLSPHVEEAVLDRFARERREAGADRAGGGRRRRLALRGRRAFAAAAAAGVAVLVALALLLPLGGSDGGAAYASVSLDPLAPASDATAYAKLDDVPAGTRIQLRSRGLPADAEYEVWCVRTDGRWVSGGTFWADADGRAEAELTAAVRPGDYHRMVVTRAPQDARDSGRGPTVLRGALRY
jgi:Anti-sigma-K factor rskA/Putative zinc-finger